MAGWFVRLSRRLKAAWRDPWFHATNLVILCLVGLLWWNGSPSTLLERPGPVLLACSGSDHPVLSEPTILPRAPAWYLLEVKQIQESSAAYIAQQRRRRERLEKLSPLDEAAGLLAGLDLLFKSHEVSAEEEGTERGFRKRAMTAANRRRESDFWADLGVRDRDRPDADHQLEALLLRNFDMALSEEVPLADSDRLFGVDQYLAHVMRVEGTSAALQVARVALPTIRRLTPAVSRMGAVLHLRLGHLFESEHQPDQAAEFYEAAVGLAAQDLPQVAALAQLRLASLYAESDKEKADSALAAARGFLEGKNAKDDCFAQQQVSLLWLMTEVLERRGETGEAERLRDSYLRLEEERWRRREG